MKTIQDYLKKVTESKEFLKSHTYNLLLTYLIEQTLDGTPPKEACIAIEVFNQSGAEWQSGSKVRVYVYNLRKKLDTYYRNEGKDDLVKFFIPKGSYKVDFIKEKSIIHGWHRYQTIIWQSLVFILLLLSIYQFVYDRRLGNVDHRIVKSTLWSSFIDSPNKTKVVIGDYYVMSNIATNSEILFTRNVEINSDEDFDQMQRNTPMGERIYKKSTHTFLGKFAPYTIQQVSPLLSSFKVEPDMLLSSQFRWNDINNANLIYIGPFKTLQSLGVFLNGANFEYNIMPNRLKFIETESDSTHFLSSHGSDINNAYETDYAVVTKIQTAENNTVLMIMASRDIGLMAGINLLTDPDLLKHFEEESGINNSDVCFEACFRIEGLNRNVIDTELQFLNIIDRRSVVE